MDIIKAQSCRNLSSTNRPTSGSLYGRMRHHNQMSMVRGFPRNLEGSCLWEIRDSASSSNSESECIREEMRWGVNVGGRGSGRRDGAGEDIRDSVLWCIQAFPLTRDHGSSALNRDPALGSGRAVVAAVQREVWGFVGGGSAWGVVGRGGAAFRCRRRR